MSRVPDRFASAARGQSEVIGTVLIFGLVVITVSAIGLVVVTDQQERADRERPSIDVEGDVGESWATVTHAGGRDIPLADLDLVLRSDGTETRLTLDDPAVMIEDGDGDDVFEGSETANVSHAHSGAVRLLLVETTDPTRVLYDETFGSDGDGGGGGDGATGAPSVDRFDVNDTSSGGDASYDVTWRASDPDDDATGATLSLVDQETNTVVDSESDTFAGTGDTGTRVGNLTNASGSGRVYILKLTVTDAAGNAATETVVDTADSALGLRDPVIVSYDVTDTTKGNTASYDTTFNATDDDGDLVWVNVTLVNKASGVEVDSVTRSYDQVEMTGETTASLTAGKQTKDETYYINVTATDATGRTAAESVVDTADGGGGGGGGATAPTIAQFDAQDLSVCGKGSKQTEYEVVWNVTDDEGDLDSLLIELLDKNGNQLTGASPTVAGSQASGTTTLTPNGNQCGKDVTVRISATDAAGNSGTDSWTDTVDGTGSS
jgi:hypothetical protein